MATRAIPFDDKAGMGARASGETGVAAEVLLCQVEAFCCGIDAGSTQSVPQIAKCKQQPECDIRSISAHVTQTRRMKSESLSAPASRKADSTRCPAYLCKRSIECIDLGR